MNPYILVRDPETDEVIVGDRRTNVFFLRGPANEESAIQNLIQAANKKIHQSEAIDDDEFNRIERLDSLLDQIREMFKGSCPDEQSQIYKKSLSLAGGFARVVGI